MIYLAAALFFTLALLAALVGLHMMVRFHGREILMALRGELGAVNPRARAAAPSGATARPHAAF